MTLLAVTCIVGCCTMHNTREIVVDIQIVVHFIVIKRFFCYEYAHVSIHFMFSDSELECQNGGHSSGNCNVLGVSDATTVSFNIVHNSPNHRYTLHVKQWRMREPMKLRRINKSYRCDLFSVSSIFPYFESRELQLVHDISLHLFQWKITFNTMPKRLKCSRARSFVRKIQWTTSTQFSTWLVKVVVHSKMNKGKPPDMRPNSLRTQQSGLRRQTIKCKWTDIRRSQITKCTTWRAVAAAAWLTVWIFAKWPLCQLATQYCNDIVVI